MREMTDTGAKFNAERTHRYRLWRAWSGAPRLGWLMMNPSTADDLGMIWSKGVRP